MEPFLQAELDRDNIRRQMAAVEREAKIMSQVPGWKVGESVYHTKSYVPPQPTVTFGQY
jgi:NADH dehydrogenase (ubiquinone) 1 alpha subcomplex subunit 13